nr:type IV secretion system protein [Providencia rustigianii]
MKQIKLALISVILGTTFTATAGIPVFIDGNPEWAVEAGRWTEKLKQWSDTIKHYDTQIQSYQNELLAKTGIRDVQGLIQDAQSIKNDLTAIYNQGNAFIDKYAENPTAAFSKQAQSLLSKYNVSKTCANKGYVGDAIKGCEAQFLSILSVSEYGDSLQKQLEQDNSRMESLIKQVQNAKDPKATADATNAISFEQLKFEKLQFQYQMYRDKQRDLAEYKEQLNQANFRDKQLKAVDNPPSFLDAYRESQFDEEFK